MRSNKQVIPLEEIVGKYPYTPTEDIEGGVNQKRFFYKKGVNIYLDYPEFECLFNANKIKL